MLGRFRMTVQDCLDEYYAFGGKVFGSARHFTRKNTGIIPRSQYDTSRLEKIFKRVCEERNEDVVNNCRRIRFPFKGDLCKT